MEPVFTRLLAIALALVTACGGGGNRGGSGAAAGDSLTERQRDSILAKSRIPGASGIGRALNAADSASARIRATDSVNP